MNGITELSTYIPFIKEIKEIKDLIYRRQYEAMKKVDTELLQLYWEIGEEVNRKQYEEGWASLLLKF